MKREMFNYAAFQANLTNPDPVNRVSAGLADLESNNAFTAMNKISPALVFKGPMTAKELREFFLPVVIGHPGTGTRGGKPESNVITVNRHLGALRKIGALVKVVDTDAE
jgi:hypothetical protein